MCIAPRDFAVQVGTAQASPTLGCTLQGHHSRFPRPTGRANMAHGDRGIATVVTTAVGTTDRRLPRIWHLLVGGVAGGFAGGLTARLGARVAMRLIGMAAGEEAQGTAPTGEIIGRFTWLSTPLRRDPPHDVGDRAHAVRRIRLLSTSNPWGLPLRSLAAGIRCGRRAGGRSFRRCYTSARGPSSSHPDRQVDHCRRECPGLAPASFNLMRALVDSV